MTDQLNKLASESAAEIARRQRDIDDAITTTKALHVKTGKITVNELLSAKCEGRRC